MISANFIVQFDNNKIAGLGAETVSNDAQTFLNCLKQDAFVKDIVFQG